MNGDAFESAVQALRDAHRGAGQLWHARVLELERRVNELTAENAQLRSQRAAPQREGATTSAPSTADAFECAVAVAAATVAAAVAAPVVVVADASAPVFVVPTPPSAKSRRRSRVSNAVVDVVDLSDDASSSLVTAVSKRARPAAGVAVVGDGELVGKRVGGDDDNDDDDDDDDDGDDDCFQLLSQEARPAVARPLNLRNAVALSSGKEDAMQNQPAATTGAPAAKPFRYIEPVLNRAERRRLVGRECEQCAEFYTAVCAATGREPEREAFVQAHSRHREICTPPPRTPDGFWNVDFDAADVRSDATTQ